MSDKKKKKGKKENCSKFYSAQNMRSNRRGSPETRARFLMCREPLIRKRFEICETNGSNPVIF